MNRMRNLQTIYAHGSIIYETNIIQLNPSSNCKVVKVKTDRVCAECGSEISKGSSCYTLNSKCRKRRWVCFSCIPEPGVEETREIGERQGWGVDTQLVYFSDEVDSWGRHKRFGDLDADEVESFDALREDAIWASMPDDF